MSLWVALVYVILFSLSRTSFFYLDMDLALITIITKDNCYMIMCNYKGNSDGNEGWPLRGSPNFAGVFGTLRIPLFSMSRN